MTRSPPAPDPGDATGSRSASLAERSREQIPGSGSCTGSRSARGDPAGGPRVSLVALGCRVSRADSEALAAALPGRLAVAGSGEPADVVVVNTCSITADADSTARQAIRRAARDHPGAAIVAAGCCAATCPDELSLLPGVAAVVPPRAQDGIPALVERLAAGRRSGRRPRAHEAQASGSVLSRARALVKVQDGCDRRCAFCVVPLARGRSRSVPFEEALSRVARAGERSAEVVLTGVHLGAYGRDLCPRRSLAHLVREALGRGLAQRLRLSSLEPDDLPREILAERPAALCEHFHLPLQSGSSRVLAAMRRPGSPDAYRRAVSEIAALVPGACIGADVIAGFPGESDADHRDTVALLEALPLAYLHVFPFSARPGTAAAALPRRVPRAAIRERTAELLAFSERRWRSYLGARVGEELEAVVERVEGGMARGTARRYATVRWPASGERRGTLARVRVVSSDGRECSGVAAAARRP